VSRLVFCFLNAFLTMPKESSRQPRGARLQSSTAERRARALRIREADCEMVYRCKRCDEKNLRCFVDTATGRCAGCISVNAACSLFVAEEEWEKVEQEKHKKRLALARAEEDVARAKRELLEVENRERQFARRDLAVLSVQDQAQLSESSSTVANSSVVEPVADSGWSQANNLLDPSFDQYFNDLFSGDAFLDPSLSLLPGGESPIVTSGAS
jgi:hypothetical protein